MVNFISYSPFSMNNSRKTKIFLDSGNPEETNEAVKLLGFLDGQTTNPSLITKNPKIQKKLESGQSLSNEELLEEYRNIILEIYNIIPNGDISIEVYADTNTSSDEMLAQAQKLNQWIEKPFIKFPTTLQGIQSASEATKQGLNVNMTLCFSQQQAGAVYSATSENRNGQVFISPFIGRLDDTGINGLDLIRNIRDMFSNGDGHVQLLGASIRSLHHLLYCLYLNIDIVTVPFGTLTNWVKLGKPLFDRELTKSETLELTNYLANSQLQTIYPEILDLNFDFREFNLKHNLTTKGLEKFANDWNSLTQNN